MLASGLPSISVIVIATTAAIIVVVILLIVVLSGPARYVSIARSAIVVPVAGLLSIPPTTVAAVGTSSSGWEAAHLSRLPRADDSALAYPCVGPCPAACRGHFNARGILANSACPQLAIPCTHV